MSPISDSTAAFLPVPTPSMDAALTAPHDSPALPRGARCYPPLLRGSANRLPHRGLPTCPARATAASERAQRDAIRAARRGAASSSARASKCRHVASLRHRTSHPIRRDPFHVKHVRTGVRREPAPLTSRARLIAARENRRSTPTIPSVSRETGSQLTRKRRNRPRRGRKQPRPSSRNLRRIALTEPKPVDLAVTITGPQPTSVEAVVSS